MLDMFLALQTFSSVQTIHSSDPAASSGRLVKQSQGLRGSATIMQRKEQDGEEGSGLVVILFNPPTGAGLRTLSRVNLAAEMLGYDTARIANIFPLPTASVLEVNGIGTNANVWESARKDIFLALSDASDVILAYGCQEPTGAARKHFRNQVAWLHKELEALGPQIWSVSERPRHPSRWQRHTAQHYPGVPFPEALGRSLQRIYIRI